MGVEWTVRLAVRAGLRGRPMAPVTVTTSRPVWVAELQAITGGRCGARFRHDPKATVTSVSGGTRVLVSGMGSELGSLVATLLEKERWVGEITGLDIDPPRRRLRRATFHRVEPKDRRKMVSIVREFDPQVVVHMAVWEPERQGPPRRRRRLDAGGGGRRVGRGGRVPFADQHLTVRSGICVYGRRRGAATRPDESVTPDPTTPFGRSLLDVERIAGEAGAVAGVPVTACASPLWSVPTSPALSEGSCACRPCR